MTSNAFMLPALPQPPAAGFSGTGKTEPKSNPSTRPDGPADEGRDFLATLNQVAHRKNPDGRESRIAEKTAPVSEGSDKTPAKPGKICDSQNQSQDVNDTPGGRWVGKRSPAFTAMRPIWKADNLLADFPILDGLSVSDLNQSESEPDASLSVFMNLLNLPQSQRQELMAEWLAGFDFGGELPADISPQAVQLNLFEYLSAKGIYPQADGNALGANGNIFGFWNWLASAAEGMSPGSAEALSANMNEPFTDLLHLREALSVSLDLGQNTGDTGGLKAAADGEAIHAIEAFLAKLANTISTKESESAEDTHQTGASKETRTSFWTPGNLNSETRLELPLMQEGENSQQHKLQAAAKTAEQPAQPVLNAEGAAVKPAEDGTGFKIDLAKNSIALSDSVDNKQMPGEGESKDGSLLFAQGQTPEHLARIAGTSRTTDSAQSDLSSKAMNQIVQKAVLSLGNGQSEAQIDLKPDFLGHIRMQIVTENHQVAIKIVTEFPFVKDMLQSNLTQLKAELQAQGLEIDQLEVSVAHDSNHRDSTNPKLNEASQLRSSVRNMIAENEESEEKNQSQGSGDGAIGETAIDFFV
jgi:flagellar hook-length control protein FliK